MRRGLQGPAEQADALAHPEQAVPGGRPEPGGRDGSGVRGGPGVSGESAGRRPPVVADQDVQEARAPAQRDAGRAGPGVPQGVAQRLLDDPVGRQLQRGTDLGGLTVLDHVHPQALGADLGDQIGEVGQPGLGRPARRDAAVAEQPQHALQLGEGLAA
nr:hypothetical protein GCM10020093_112380 [Planobispora longispora]